MGGYCKHVVALLLAYLREPEEFVQRESVNDLLSTLSRDELAGLIANMASRDPNLYDWLEMAIPAVRASDEAGGAQIERRRKTQVSAQSYRRRSGISCTAWTATGCRRPIG
jgi:uncharacterized Zn finger protein